MRAASPFMPMWFWKTATHRAKQRELSHETPPSSELEVRRQVELIRRQADGLCGCQRLQAIGSAECPAWHQSCTLPSRRRNVHDKSRFENASLDGHWGGLPVRFGMFPVRTRQIELSR